MGFNDKDQGQVPEEKDNKINLDSEINVDNRESNRSEAPDSLGAPRETVSNNVSRDSRISAAPDVKNDAIIKGEESFSAEKIDVKKIEEVEENKSTNNNQIGGDKNNQKLVDNEKKEAERKAKEEKDQLLKNQLAQEQQKIEEKKKQEKKEQEKKEEEKKEEKKKEEANKQLEKAKNDKSAEEKAKNNSSDKKAEKEKAEKERIERERKQKEIVEAKVKESQEIAKKERQINNKAVLLNNNSKTNTKPANEKSAIYSQMVKTAATRMQVMNDNFNRKYGTVHPGDPKAFYESKRLLEERLSKVPKEKRQAAFLKEFRDTATTFMQTNMKQVGQLKRSGKNFNVVESSMEVDAYMQRMFEFYKLGNKDLNGMEYPQFGGVPLSQVKGMQLNAFASASPERQSQKERAQINDYYQKNVLQSRKSEQNKFYNFVNGFNQRQNLKFDPKGIDAYLKNRWEELSSKPLNERRAMFEKELNEFSLKAFERMNKGKDYINYAQQMKDFDNFVTGMQEYSKACGYLDANTPNKYLAGITAGQIKDIQMAAINKRPQTIESKAFQNVYDITGVSRDSVAYQKKYGFTYADISTGARIDNFNKSIVEIVDKVPNKSASKGGVNNKEFVEAAKTLYALDKINSERSRTWKFFHRREHKAYTEAFDRIKSCLESKNYDITDILAQGRAEPNRQNDMVYAAIQQQKQNVENMYFNVSNMSFQRENSQIQANFENDKLKIFVAEADNTKEITNPQNVAPFTQAPIKENILNKQNGLQTTN